MKTLKITKQDKKKPKFLTDEELTQKLVSINASFSRYEKLQDELLDIISYLIACRDGHRHKMTIGAAIAKANKIYEEIGKMELRNKVKDDTKSEDI